MYPLPSPAVQINHNWEVEYQDTNVYGVVGKAVILECGTTLPDMYIWSFTKPGTEAIKAVVYDLGKGTRIQKLAEELGRLSVISNSAAVSIEELPLAAHGLFTCQAFYDIEQEPKVVYYYVHLTVRGKTSLQRHREDLTTIVIPTDIFNKLSVEPPGYHLLCLTVFNKQSSGIQHYSSALSKISALWYRQEVQESLRQNEKKKKSSCHP